MAFYADEERTFIGPEVDTEEHPIVKWEWNFGDGTVVTCPGGTGCDPTHPNIVRHTYTTPETYTVRLKTTNDCGASSECTEPITIEPTPDYWWHLAPGDNLVSCPVDETRAIADIPELAPVDIWQIIGGTWTRPTHFEAGIGYYMYNTTTDVINVPLYGADRIVSAEDIVAILGLGLNLVGPGATDVDISGTFVINGAKHEFYPVDEGGFVTDKILRVGAGYYIYKNDFEYTYPGAAPEAGESITFKGLPSGLSVIYSWDFGDGTTAEGEEVTHIYSEAASYTVTLELKDTTTGGTLAKVSKDIAVGVCPVPSCAFTIE